MNIHKIVKLVSIWLMRFSFYTVTILATGTAIGIIGFVTIGSLFAKGYTLGFLLKKGAWVGFRYAGVWAGGSAIVLCCMKAKQLRDKKELIK